MSHQCDPVNDAPTAIRLEKSPEQVQQEIDEASMESVSRERPASVYRCGGAALRTSRRHELSCRRHAKPK